MDHVAAAAAGAQPQVIVGAALCPSPPLLARDVTGQADILPDLRAACAAAVRALLAARPDVVAVIGPADSTLTWNPAARLDLADYAPALAAARPGPAGNLPTVPSTFSTVAKGASGRPPSLPEAPSAGDPHLPLSLGIGAILLDEAGYAGARVAHSIAESESPDACADLGRALATPVRAASTAAPVVTPGEAPSRMALLIMGDGSARRSVSAPGYLDERAEPFDAEVERALRDGDLPALAALDPALARDLMVTGRAPLQVLAAALSAGSRRQPSPKADVLYSAAPLGVAYLVAAITLRG